MYPTQEAPVLLEVKQKDFDTILVDVDVAMLGPFFASCRQIGFFGEERTFILHSFADFTANVRKDLLPKGFFE